MNDFDLYLKENKMSDEELHEWMKEVDVDHLLEIKSDKYHKNKSKIHGTGLFATRDIEKKELVGIVSFDTKRTTLARYTNHSDKPNIEFEIFKEKSKVDVVAFAVESIKKNEELLVNYRHKRIND